MWQRGKMKSAGAMTIPSSPPSPNIIHNHRESLAGVVVAVFICLLIALVLGWQLLLHLVEEMGYQNPEAAIGWAGAGCFIVLFLSTGAYFLATYPLRDYYRYRLELEAIRGQNAQSYAMMAARPQFGESRLTTEQSQLATLLRVVMEEAYRHLAEVGQYVHGESKPWSRRSCAGKLLPGFDSPVTEKMATDVRGWLIGRRVLDQDEVDVNRYPTYQHFEKLLEQEFYMPVQVRPMLPGGNGVVGRWEHIEGRTE